MVLFAPRKAAAAAAGPETAALLALEEGAVQDSSRGEVRVAVERQKSAASGPDTQAPTPPSTFRWNNRTCMGNSLHVAALNKDRKKVEEILDAGPQLIDSRFSYETRFKGAVQEGSGEAIHIAASRDAVDVVQCLLKRKARLDAAVTRDHKAHYNVLHAAVFAEGKGGSERMVQMLLDAGASITPNGDKRWPLHLAFQTGQVELIRMLRKETELRGLLEEAEADSSDVPSPLKVGIQMRKLSEEQLSQVAGLTPQSLLIFIHHEPKCIPMFLKRWEQEGGMCAEDLANLVKVKDLSKVIHESGEAADAIIYALMDKPKTQSEGWHPLPTRLSLAPRTGLQKIQSLMNPDREYLSLYVPDKDWAFDSNTHEPPAWHAPLTDMKLGRPICDVQIKVCKVPNIVCAEFLAALCHCHTADDDRLFIFQNTIVRCMLDYVWWQGAIKVDILQVVLSIWGLSLLIVETWLIKVYGKKAMGISDDFIGARAVVDLGHEVAQFIGYVKIGQQGYYLDWGNAYDLFRCTLPAMLFCMRNNRLVRVLVILIYWMRLLEVNFSESVSRELLPITRLAKGLLPASIVAFIGFCGLTHAFCELGELDEDLPDDPLLSSFAMLITGNIPEMGHFDQLRLLMTYASVLMFTVFFLNIFISVIGENYSIQKRLSPLVFQGVRSSICCTYLLRASVIPCWLCSVPCAVVLFVLAALAMLLLQLAVVTSDVVVPFTPALIVLCQSAMLVASYQKPDMAWGCRRPSGGPQEDHFLWSVEAIRADPPSQLDKVQEQLDKMQTLLNPRRAPWNGYHGGDLGALTWVASPAHSRQPSAPTSPTCR